MKYHRVLIICLLLMALVFLCSCGQEAASTEAPRVTAEVPAVSAPPSSPAAAQTDVPADTEQPEAEIIAEEAAAEAPVETSPQVPETLSITEGSVFNEALLTNKKNITSFSVQYAAGWCAEDRSGALLLSKDGTENPPFITAEELGWVAVPEKFVPARMDLFKETYQNRMAQPPVDSTLELAGRSYIGFTAKYSAVDGSATITRQEYVTVMDDIAYFLACEYVSGAYGDLHEDETTYFEFMNALETFTVHEVIA